MFPKLGKIKNREQTLSRSLLSILVSLLLMISLVFFFIYSMLRTQLLENAYEHEQEHIKSVCSAAESVEKNAASLLSQLTNNLNVKKLVYSQIPGSISIINAMTDFKEYIASVSFVSSAYILNQNQSLVIYTDIPELNSTPSYATSFKSMKDFPDSEFCYHVLSNGKHSQNAIFRDISGFSEKHRNRKVLTYYNVFQSRSNKIDGAFILNVDVAYLLENLSSQDTGNQIIIAADENNYYTDDNDIISPEEIKEIISQIVESGDSIGQSTYHCISGNVLCTWNRSPSLPFCVISSIPYSSIIAQLKTTSQLICGFYVGALLISLSCVLFFSYKAKRSMVRQVADYEKLNQIHSNSRKYVNNALVRSFLFSIEETSVLMDRFKENGIPIYDFKSFSIIVFEINSSGKNENPVHELVKECIDTVTTVYGRYIVTDVLQNRFVLIIESPKEETCSAILDGINSMLSRFGKNTLIGVFDADIDGNSLIPNAYKVLARQISLFYFYPNESCLDSKLLAMRKCVGYETLNHLHPTLLQAFSEKKYDDFLQLFNDFLVQWFEGPNEIRNTLELILRIMTDCIQNLRVSASVYFDYDEQKLRDNLTRCGSVDEVRRVVFDFIDEIRLVVSEPKNMNCHVKYAQRIISDRYADQSLCIESIAGEIGISASHLCSLFKAETGLSLAEYLKNYRLQIAAELLLTENSTVTSISEQVGYTNATYFHAVFKKRYGVTPNEYRLMQRSRRDNNHG